MYENEIIVTVQLQVAVKVDSYDLDEVSMNGVYEEAEEKIRNAIVVDHTCSLRALDIRDFEYKGADFIPVEEAA